MATYYGTNGRDIFDGGRQAERVYGLAGDDDLFGYGGNDILFGDDGNDLLVGGTGDDRLAGGAGSDLLAGEEGDDTLNGGSGYDYATYFYAAAGVRIDLSTGVALDGDGGRDRLTQIEGVYGSDFADRITGNAGVNELFGNAGNDLLIGGGGQDLTVGGAGADRFLFADGDFSANLGRADLIGDFSHADRDRIDLRGVDANTTTAGDDAFTFIGQSAFTGVAGELRYTFADGETVLSADLNGDRVADLFIRVEDQQALVQADFVL
jgi:Ca2+-binding RTX toxin-like protein